MNDSEGFRKALVTGGAGFIGSHLVERLIRRGIETIVLDNLHTGKLENLPREAHFVQGDICEPGTLRQALHGVDIVFHLAARVSIRDSFRGFEEDVHTNVMGTANLLKALEGSGVKRFIYASSMAVYGDADYLPIDEHHPLSPTSPYGISKLAGEKYVICLCRHLGIKPLILRYFNTYGRRQAFTPYVGVTTIFIQKLRRRKALPVFGNGNQVRDFIHVEDVAEANLLAMDYEGSHDTFNVGTGKGTSVNELACLLHRAFSLPLQVVHLPQQPGEPGGSIADTNLAQRELGFRPVRVFAGELPAVIDWYKETVSMEDMPV